MTAKTVEDSRLTMALVRLFEEGRQRYLSYKQRGNRTKQEGTT